MSSSICGTRIRTRLLVGSALVALTGWLCSTTPLVAQSATPGWTLQVRATGVSTLSGGEALAADPTTGNVFVKSLQDPSGSPVQLARVTPGGSVSILGTFTTLRNSDGSGIAIDPMTGGIIVADEVSSRIALIDPSSLSVSTLFSVPWTMNPSGNGTGQQQYAPGSTSNILYFWDSTVSKLFSLNRSTSTLTTLLALDQTTANGMHFSTFTNDLAFDQATGTVLLADNLSHSVFEINPATSSVTTLFFGIPSPTVAIALKGDTKQVFLTNESNIYVGPRTGGSLSVAASGFTGLTDMVIGKATSGVGLSVFGVSKNLNTLYELTETPVYVSTFNGNQILAVGSTTGAVKVLNIDTTKLPEDIVVGPDGKIYICDPVENDIRRMNQDGSNVETVYSFSATTSTQCNGGACPTGPEGPSFSTTGDLYFNTRGSPATHTGVWKIPAAQLSPIPSGGATPVNVVPASATSSTFGEGTTFDATDKLLFVDRSGGKVWRFDTSTSTLTNIISSLIKPFGIAVNPSGDIFVSDGGANSVKHYLADGTSKGAFVTFATTDEPAYLQFDASGNLFVLTNNAVDGGNGKLWRVDPSGTPVTQLAGAGTSNTFNTSNFAVGLGLPATTFTTAQQAVAPNTTTTFTDGTIINETVAIPSGANMGTPATAFKAVSFIEIAPAVFSSTRLPGTTQSPNWSGGTTPIPAGTTCTVIANTDGNCIVMRDLCFDSSHNPIVPCNITTTTATLIQLTSLYKTQSPQTLPGLIIADDNQNNWASLFITFNPADPTISGGTKTLNTDTAIVNFGDFSLSAVSPLTVSVGGSASTTVTVSSVGAFNSMVTLAVPSPPSGVSTSFSSPNPVTPPSGGSTSSTLTVNVGPSVTPSTFTLTVTGTFTSPLGFQVTRSTSVSVTVSATTSGISNVIGSLLAAGCIDNSGIATALTSKLSAAQAATDIQTEINILTALKNQIQAQAGKHIATSCTIGGVTFNPVTVLLTDVQSLINSLRTSVTPDPITGYAVNSTGTGIAGATLTMLDSAGHTLATATTDITGFYYFATTGILTPGSSYTVQVTGFPAGFTTSTPSYQTFTWGGSGLTFSFSLI